MKRTATAVWNGTGKDGHGIVSTASEVLKKTQYSFKSRFENGTGTNPEELIAAAHAGCFSMKLAFSIQEAGFIADEIHTECTITLEGLDITSSHLVLRAKVPGIDKTGFDKATADAKSNCPVSKLLNTKISLDATLL